MFERRPFDPSVMTWFRERITPEMLSEVNDYIIGSKEENDEEDDKDKPSPDDDPGSGEEQDKQGTLILNATCVSQNIRFPTDVSLLNEGREFLEDMIDTAHEAGATEGEKPRTYRHLARQAYLSSLALERERWSERNEIEGCIGVCKRRYRLDLVMTRLERTSGVNFHAAILTRNLFRRPRFLLWFLWRVAKTQNSREVYACCA